MFRQEFSRFFFSAVNGTGRHISRAGFNSLLLRDLLSGDILYNLSIHVPRLSLSAQPMGEDKGGNKAIWSNNESLTVDQGGHVVSVTFEVAVSKKFSCFYLTLECCVFTYLWLSLWGGGVWGNYILLIRSRHED